MVGRATASGQAFDRGAWQQDYATLKQALEKRYSNLAWFASPEGGVDLPALDRRTLAALNASASDDEARSTIQSFVRGFHDGHFSQLATLEPPSAAKGPTLAAPALTRQDAASGCAALSFAPHDLPQFSLGFESLPGFRLIADGITTPFRAGILTGGPARARLGIVRIPSFEESSDFASCVKAWTGDDMWNALGRLRRAALDAAVEQSWYASLAGMLRTFAAESVAAVLVDVGNNSGGDDSGDIATRLFTTKPMHSAPLWMTQDSAASIAYFDEQLGALRTAQKIDSTSQVVKSAMATFERGKGQLSTNVCPMDWVWRERRAWTGNACHRLVEAGSAGGPLSYLAPDSARNARVAERLHWPSTKMALWGTWGGPVYVLTDSRTYSSAEMFVAALKNNGAARTVGVRTGGDGCGFMNTPDPVILPHSGMRFRVPNCVRMRADGTDEVAGIAPDIPVLPREEEATRARAMRVFDEVVEDLKRTSSARP